MFKKSLLAIAATLMTVSTFGGALSVLPGATPISVQA